MKQINMLSKADMVKGQGVLSAFDEQVNLVKDNLSNQYEVIENSFKCCPIMHYHTINPEFLLTLPFAKRKGICVGYVHFLPETLENSITLPRWMKKIFYKYVLFFYKRMDHLVTVNPYFIDVLERYHVNRNKVTYIPNFVSDQMFYPMKADNKSGLRNKYKLPVDKFTVLCAGQLQKRKGIFDFFEIAEKMPHVQFIWAGSFAFGKISEGFVEIKKKMEDLPDNVKILGLIDRDKMNEVYNLADIMFLPSLEELFPMKILEAMNCAIPIVVRDLDIYENILFDFCLKGKNNGEFMSIIERLRIDEIYNKNAKKKSFNGHIFYSREHVASMWEEFYGTMLELGEAKKKGFVNGWKKN